MTAPADALAAGGNDGPAGKGRPGLNQPHLGTEGRPTLRAYFAGNTMALMAGLLAAYLALLHGHSITQSTIKTGDFIAYYSGSHLLVQGHGAQLYDFGALGRLQTSLLHPLVVRGGILMPYLYPAYLAMALAPLAALPYTGAYTLWLLLNCSMLIVVMYALERYAGLVGRSAALVRLAALCSLPVLLTLFNGQTSILITALFATCFFAARSGRDRMAGVALACAMVKLPYVLPLILVFAMLRRWSLLRAFLLTACCLMAVPMAVLGLSIDQRYVHTLLEATKWHAQFGYADARNDSLAGFAQLLLPSTVAGLTRIVLCLAALSLLVWCTRRSSSLDLPFGLAVVVALLVSPHVLAHDLTLLLIPVAVALRHREIGPPHLRTVLILGYLAVAIGYWLAFAIPIQLPVVAMCALAIWLWSAATRESSGRAAASRGMVGESALVEPAS